MNYAVILAGGVGSRFWPISKTNTPKQIIRITGQTTPLQNTIKRINGFVNSQNIFLITNNALQNDIKLQASQLNIPKKNTLIEPARKNTALPIIWSAFQLHKKDPESIMIILPADHFINDKKNFYLSLKKAIKFAENGYLVTIGIKPTHPETAYGYIKTGIKIDNAFNADRFIEKPDLEKSRIFVKKNNYFWNSGIFIWKTKVILEEFKKYLPEIYFGIVNAKNKHGLTSFWKKADAVSIDYGILEKSKKIILIPASFNWVDIGSWDALDKVIKKDSHGNIVHGKAITLDSSNLIIWSDDRLQTKKLIATIGIKDLIIVESENAILVCHKNNAQDVKKISHLLNKK